MPKDVAVSDMHAWLKQFIERASMIYYEKEGLMMKKLRKSDGLIYEGDFATDNDLVSLYVAHRFLYENHELVAKDPTWKHGGPYHKRPDNEVEALSRLASIGNTYYEASAADKQVLRTCSRLACSPSWHNFNGSYIYAKLGSLFQVPIHSQRDVAAKFSTIEHSLPYPVESPFVKQHGHLANNSLFPSSYNNRHDFTALPVYSIDPPGTVEVDDGVSIEQCGGRTWLHIHIADPTDRIPLDTDLDLLAREKVSSIYLPHEQHGMLPREIATTFSLDHNVNALTFSASFKSGGDIDKFEIRPSIIKSPVRLTYDDADQCPPEDITKTSEITAAHNSWRKSKGLLELSFPRSEIKVLSKDKNIIHKDNIVTDLDGTLLELINNNTNLEDSDETHTKDIVSEAMIIAGRIASMHAIQHSLPIIFRYHSIPKNDVAARFAENPQDIVAAYHFLQIMTPSAVDIQPRPHEGMALEAYSRVTSPIRRYLDMLTHHQLHAHLSGKPPIKMPDLAPIYRTEQYIRAYSRYCTRHWLYRYINAIKANTIFEGIVVNHGFKDINHTVVLKNPAMILSLDFSSKIPVGTSIRFRIDCVDVYTRRIIQSSLIN